MAHVLHSGIEEPRPCSYLVGVSASLEHKVMLEVSPDEVEHLLDRGWRHFGPTWFRPACAACQECVSTRIVVDEFLATRSQMRAHRRASRLRVAVGEPTIDKDRLDLFQTWQNERVGRRGWEATTIDAKEYFMQFAFPTPVAREVAYYDDHAGKLVMLAVCDETPNSWNAVFCFYDPAYGRMSPGIANIINLVALAQATQRRYVHLGYSVAGCPSLRYKSAFRPQEVLVGLPAEDETPRWNRI